MNHFITVTGENPYHVTCTCGEFEYTSFDEYAAEAVGGKHVSDMGE